MSDGMEILSISIDKEALRQLEEVQKRLGIKSRSKMLRNAILGMLKEYQLLDSLSGHVEGVFVLTYKKSEKNHVSDVLHRFEGIIRTEVHQHNSGICTDVLTLGAHAEKVREFFATLKRNKCIYSVTYSLIPDSKARKDKANP